MTDTPQDNEFSGEQKRYLEGYMSGLTVGRAVHTLTSGRTGGKATGEPTGPDAIHIKAQDRVLEAGGKLSDPEKFKRELNPLDGYAQLESAGAQQRGAQAGRQFPLAFPWAVLRRAGAELLHVPAAHSQRHPHARQIRGPCRSGGAIRRRLFACHHARQPPDARDRAEERRRDGRRRSRSSACARAARAPTISATSPARRPPVSTHRS